VYGKAMNTRETDMRSFLLKSVSLLGMAVTAIDPTFAQAPPSVFEGVAASPLPIQAANNSNNTNALPKSGGVAAPAPGTIVVHLNGRVAFYGVAESTSLDKTPGTGSTNAGAAKLSNYGTVGFMRLYPGVDAMATNGLRYGASVEIRQNFGPTSNSTASSGSSANSSSSTLFVRRAFAYFANDTLGILRVGQGDGPIGLFDLGVTTFQNFDTGGWDNDSRGLLPSNANVT